MNPRQSSRIQINEVRYIESLADYIRIHMDKGSVVQSRKKINRMESSIPGIFVHIHRSFIVNKEKVSTFSREEVLIGSINLPISRSSKNEALEKLSRQDFGIILLLING